MAMNKTILRWWLIGYATGDSTLQNWGLKTSSANPMIAERLKMLLGDPWVRPPRGSNRKRLYVFKITDPDLIKLIMSMKQGRAPRRFGRVKMLGWIAGYLDADGSVLFRDSNLYGEFFTIDWRLVRLIVRVLEGLRKSWRIGLDYRYRGHLRKHPLFRIYSKDVDDIPSIKVMMAMDRY